MTIINGNSLTKEEELQYVVQEFNIAQVYTDYMVLEHKNLKNIIRRLISKQTKEQSETRLQQLQFLDNLFHYIKNFEKTVKMQAYLLLGGLEYAQDKWGEFPETGPLRDLLLKKDDLIQVISENTNDINLEIIFNDPTHIQKKAVSIFLEYIASNPNLKLF